MGASTPKKATDEQLRNYYLELGSVRKVAAIFGMCGQSVHERLVKLGASNKVRRLSRGDQDRLERQYENYADIGRLDDLANEMGRTKPYLARQAKYLGLTKPARKKPYLSEISSVRFREWHRNNPHPRGMLGKHHTDAMKDATSQRSFGRWHSMTKVEQVQFQRHSIRQWKADWRIIGGKRSFYRSSWEANYARYLEWLRLRGNILEWEHEPKCFWFHAIKRGTRSYLPDFAVLECSNKITFHEVKGWMDAGSKTKLKRMAKYYPSIIMVLIDAKSYKSIAKMMAPIIRGWE